MRIIILPLTVIWLYTFSVTKELACYLLLFPNHPISPMNLTMVFSLTFLFLCLLLCVSCCVLLMVVQCIVAITLHLTSKCFTTGRAVSVPQPCCGTDGILAEALPLVHKSLRCSTQCSRNQSTALVLSWFPLYFVPFPHYYLLIFLIGGVILIFFRHFSSKCIYRKSIRSMALNTHGCCF